MTLKLIVDIIKCFKSQADRFDILKMTRFDPYAISQITQPTESTHFATLNIRCSLRPKNTVQITILVCPKINGILQANDTLNAG